MQKKEIRCININKGHKCNRLIAIIKSEELNGELEFRCPRCKAFNHFKDGNVNQIIKRKV